ncbi:MAG TPA: tRNA (adenosine(37)-N6)-threonylcarbamoyltransferase complex ATPase subunit type 1 TsaE [Gammaproteobacteria bacterium]|jgi:tRNA threonylcarbamoyladenosine biosynthesis protein TsaE|nr:tRNA (adenosine(37)-N6)-threonylcarbamoyltransferase complex ATPase subunit type 1 TsaE [Gammaproteobacteria bacterium]
MKQLALDIPDEPAMVALACRIANALPEDGLVIALSGDLGAGKTTLVRAMLRALGVEGYIRSPTYTLVEPYKIGGRQIYHLDLYRLGDPGELEFLGVRDLDPATDLILVEWPERGGQSLPAADLAVEIDLAEPGRRVELRGHGARGGALLTRLSEAG